MKARRPSSKNARNERRKAIANALNALAVAVVVGAILQPLVNNRLSVAIALSSLAAFVFIHALVYYILGRLED